jgi:hypothetical protein
MADIIRRCSDCGWAKVNGVCTNPTHADDEEEPEEEGMSEQAEREMEWDLELARCARDCRR